MPKLRLQTTRSLPSLAVCGAGHQDGSEGKQMESKTEIAEDVTNIAVKDMKHSAWFGSMRDSLWQRPKDGKRVISGQPARSPRSPTRIETDVQVSMLTPRRTRRMHDTFERVRH